MKNMLNIGGDAAPQAVDAFSKAFKEMVEVVFRVGAETHMEQDTIRHAITKFQMILGTQNVNISNCEFLSGKPADDVMGIKSPTKEEQD